MCELPVKYQEEEEVVDRFKVKFVQRMKDEIVTKQKKAKKLEKLNKILQIVLGEGYMVLVKETKPKKSVLYRLRKFFVGCFMQCFPRQKKYN